MDRSTVDRSPGFSIDEARRLALDLFGLHAETRELPSERDQNFLFVREDGERFVLKIANSTETREVLEFQNEVLEHLLRTRELFADECLEFRFSTPAPRPLAGVDGARICSTPGAAGATHLVRLLSWVPGTPLARVRPHGPDLLRSLGAFLATLDRALEGFDHPAAHREFYWDLRHAVRVVEQYAPAIDRKADRAIVESFLVRFRSETSPVLGALPRAVIHNDGNDYNVLVTRPDPWRLQVGGVIDFGDMLHTCRVAEPAIAAAYATLGKSDPLAAAARVVGGYHAVLPLAESEIEALFPLLCMRLAMSVSIAAHQRKQAPGNEYLSISEKPARAALRRLAEIHPRLAAYTLRQACGMIPCLRSRAVVSYLKTKAGQGEIRPVVPVDGGTEEPVVVFDLSVGSVDPAALLAWSRTPVRPYRASDAGAWSALLFGAMAAAGARVGVGRYDEPRWVYTTDQFEVPSEELPERRTIHLGTDLFAEAGTPVHAPLEARVHSACVNAAELDYGPTIILEHTIDGADGDGKFYTLFGHLSPESLDGMQPGLPVAAGQPIGTIGAPPENGGWPPHLHFQIIADVLDEQGNFPGVAAPSRREIWLSLCPDPRLILGLPAAGETRRPRSAEQILAVRRGHLGPSLSVAYADPLHIVRGSMQYLYDAEGRAYLDTVNNVSHVGHCHPRVVRAGQAQMAVLNTNTRYLHDNLAEYVERLLETLPPPLQVCYLVCSGSEANELALRLARTHTQRDDIVTLDGAYHGNTQALIDVSPYKFDGPGGGGAPPHVHRAVMPDPFRGPYRGAGSDSGLRYAAHVASAIERAQRRSSGGGPAAFICEPLMGCGGQVVLPEGYLREAYRMTRDAGGVCIADEVQIGFGRVGTHFWGFETQGVVPDIVTLGKPIGNGHPLAAVITTPEIAASLATGMEYFNTFGGNPVSCAIGLAVLDVIREAGLQEHAREVGARLKNGLAALKDRHPLIGDVRGMGLFLGIELVVDPETREPAPRHATYLIERMKEHGILLSVDGPRHNVLKLKPPLVFDRDDADRFVRTLETILAEDCLR